MVLVRTLSSRSAISSRITSRLTSLMASRCFSNYVISPSQLALALNAKAPPASASRIVPLSAEWFMPNDPRTGISEFQKLRIPTARFFDLDDIKDAASPYPHMLPSAAVFAVAMGKLGITRADTVVVYDSPSLGIFSAPRAAWTLRVFGHKKVHLLNNFKVWVEEGLPVETGPVAQVQATVYEEVAPDLQMVADFEEVKTLAELRLGGGESPVQLLDARPEGRFRGVELEPRPGLPSGHVPGAISVPFSDLVDPVTKKLKTGKQLRRILLDKGVDPSDKVEKKLMCGTGVTAVVIETALQLAGIPGKRVVYDGSWTEWAQRVPAESGLIVREQTN